MINESGIDMNKKLIIVPVLPGALSNMFTSQSAWHGDNQIQGSWVQPMSWLGYISLANAGGTDQYMDQDQD